MPKAYPQCPTRLQLFDSFLLNTSSKLWYARRRDVAVCRTTKGCNCPFPQYLSPHRRQKCCLQTGRRFHENSLMAAQFEMINHHLKGPQPPLARDSAGHVCKLSFLYVCRRTTSSLLTLFRLSYWYIAFRDSQEQRLQLPSILSTSECPAKQAKLYKVLVIVLSVVAPCYRVFQTSVSHQEVSLGEASRGKVQRFVKTDADCPFFLSISSFNRFLNALFCLISSLKHWWA